VTVPAVAEGCELSCGLGSRSGEGRRELLLDDVEGLEDQAGSARSRTEGGGDAQALGGGLGQLVPPALGGELALGGGAGEE